MRRAGPGVTRMLAHHAPRWRRLLLLQLKPVVFAAEPRRAYNTRCSIPGEIDKEVGRFKLLSGSEFLLAHHR